MGRNGTNWSTNPEVSGSWLRTERRTVISFSNWNTRISTRGNSGVHFRSALEKNPTFTGYEMQINDDAGREPRKNGSGAILRPGGSGKEHGKACRRMEQGSDYLQRQTYPAECEWRRSRGL